MFREFEVSDTSDSAQYTKHQVGKDLGQVFYFLFYETGYAIYYTDLKLTILPSQPPCCWGYMYIFHQANRVFYASALLKSYFLPILIFYLAGAI